MKLSEIRAACKAATPGPWEGDKACVVTSKRLPLEARAMTIAVCSPSAPVPVCPHCGERMTHNRITEAEAKANRNFIAIARRALPALLEALDAVGDWGELFLRLEEAGIEVDE